MKSFKDLPKYDDLPDKRRYWEWGPPGSYEEGLGKLNLLTPQVVTEAAKEIQTGERVALSWDMDKPEVPQFFRQGFEHNIKCVYFPYNYDDEYKMNPQASSQWDGFRHQGQPKDISKHRGEKGIEYAKEHGADATVEFYGGTKPSEIEDKSNGRIGIQHWAKRGIVGRAVLVDYYRWAQEQANKTVSLFEEQSISIDDIKQVVKHYKVDIHPGDILLVRTGFIKEWDKFSKEEKTKQSQAWPPGFAGIEQSEEVLRWIWDHHFVAVGGDAISFEKFPARHPTVDLHYQLLAGWGIPIGELFDLEELSEMCKRHGRYSFFFTSAPLNAFGAVSSTPNAIAIF